MNKTRARGSLEMGYPQHPWHVLDTVAFAFSSSSFDAALRRQSHLFGAHRILIVSLCRPECDALKRVWRCSSLGSLHHGSDSVYFLRSTSVYATFTFSGLQLVCALNLCFFINFMNNFSCSSVAEQTSELCSSSPLSPRLFSPDCSVWPDGQL